MIGRVWKFGDGVDTDSLAPGAYMKAPIEDMARHCLEAHSPEFAQSVRPGDFIVAGRNFGAGSSREQAVSVLRILGVSAVVAQSFAGIFYRNAFNLGLPAIVCAEANRLHDGDEVELELKSARIHNASRNEILEIEPVPPHLADLIEADGLMPLLSVRLGSIKGMGVR